MKKRKVGIVESDKMDKTISVVVERLVRHPRYEKYIRRRSTFKAHDPHNEAKAGDLVEIQETRPLSKTKSWRLVRVLRRFGAALPQLTEQEAATPHSAEL